MKTAETRIMLQNANHSKRILYYLKEKTLPQLLVIAVHATVTLFSLLSCVAGIYYIVISDVDFYSNEFLVHGWQYVYYFFSLWCSAIQFFYFNFVFAIDVMDYYAQVQPHLHQLRNKFEKIASYFLFAFVFPSAVGVSILFWTFYNIVDRELIYPSLLDDVYPRWVNHSMHTYPAFLSLLYMVISNKYEPPLRKTLTGMIALITVYLGCGAYVKVRDDKFPYLGLHYMTHEQRISFLTNCVIMNIFFVFVGHFTNGVLKRLRSGSK